MLVTAPLLIIGGIAGKNNKVRCNSHCSDKRDSLVRQKLTLFCVSQALARKAGISDEHLELWT